jgi:hypothetical protein
MGLETILSNPTLRNELFPIVTPLCWQAWEDHLIEAGLLEEFVDVPAGIRDGFGLSYNESLVSCYMPPNNSSARNNPDPVCAYITKEIATGWYSTGFVRASLARSPTRSSLTAQPRSSGPPDGGSDLLPQFMTDSSLYHTGLE